MIYDRLGMENFKPESWELKPFDLTKINKIVDIHPFQYIMNIKLYGYYPFFDDEGNFKDEYGHILDENPDEGELFKFINDYRNILDENPDEGELIFGCKYFEILDNYYRYGIGFDPIFNLQDENKLYIKSYYNKGWPYNKDLKDRYYILDKQRWKLSFNDVKQYNLKLLLFNDVKVIKLEDIDKGKKELTEIEKWNRRVVNRQKSLKNKLTLLNPKVYNNFLLFYKLSKSDKAIQKYHHIIDYYKTFKGIDVLSKKEFKNDYINNYKDIKIYEDHLFEKYKELLN